MARSSTRESSRWNKSEGQEKVDAHMGRLRHKVDAPNESPMIYCVRGAGFILRAPA